VPSDVTIIRPFASKAIARESEWTVEPLPVFASVRLLTVNVPASDPKCRQSEWRGHNSVTSHIDQVFIVRIDRDGEINRRLLNTVVEGRRRKLGPGRAGISRPEKSGHLVRGQIDDAGGDSPAGAVAIFMTVWLAPWIVPPLCAAPNVCVQVAPLSLLT
jgi:hypothetical protein